MLLSKKAFRPRRRTARFAVVVALVGALGTTTAGAGSAAPQPTDALWGKESPPADTPHSRAYELVLAPNAKGYLPRSGECSNEIHARYWALGPDGKVFPTWHPSRDPSGCTFGHEHGDDPRTSQLFSTAGWPAFGYTAEVMATGDGTTAQDEAMHRHEDHVGHKVQVLNDADVYQGDNGVSFQAPTGSQVVAVCDVLQKFHQGTHSPDAFTNNLHELIYNTRCTYRDTNQTAEVRFSAMIPLGRPGGFSTTDCPGPNFGGQFIRVGDPVPASSPSDTRSLGRLITEESCVQAIKEGRTHFEVLYNQDVPFDSFDLHEFWFADVRVNSSQLRFQIAPLFYVLNPSRYYKPSNPDKLGRGVDLCYEGIPGFYCDQVRAQTQRNGGQRVAWDDPASPFNGASREFRPGTFLLQNSGPTTVYTDVHGGQVSTTPFPGSIEQYFSDSNSSTSLYIRGVHKEFAGTNNPDRVHSPN